MKILHVRAELFQADGRWDSGQTDGRTDGRTDRQKAMTDLIIVFPPILAMRLKIFKIV